jgi:hypothetical protein
MGFLVCPLTLVLFEFGTSLAKHINGLSSSITPPAFGLLSTSSTAMTRIAGKIKAINNIGDIISEKGRLLYSL